MNKKKMLVTLLTIMLITVLTIGITMALLRTTTKAVTNTFTSDKEITISLREPKWDGYGFETEASIPSSEMPTGESLNLVGDDSYPMGEHAVVSTNNIYGANIANQFMPGDLIPKNPIVRNTSKEEDVYLAVTVDCIDENNNTITTEEFESKYGPIAFNTDQWTKIGITGTKDIYLYGTGGADSKIATVLGEGEVTEKAVFYQVKLLDTIGQDTDILPTFKIIVNAYAIQAKNVTTDKAAAELIAFIK